MLFSFDSCLSKIKDISAKVSSLLCQNSVQFLIYLISSGSLSIISTPEEFEGHKCFLDF